MANFAAEITNISHSYGSHKALQDINFEVQEQDFFGLLGPNGSGKTTLFRIISTLMAPDHGSCQVMGFDTVKSPQKVRNSLGIIFQNPSLDEELTVYQNLVFHGTLYGLTGKALKERILELSKHLHIDDRLQSRVSQLSGGLKRRADLVRGLLHKPRVLLLDEPTTGLDPSARHDFWQLLASFRSEEIISIILTTHLLDEAAACDKVVIMDTGRMAVQGNPDELCQNLGRKMLWLTSPEPGTLQERLTSEFGFSGERIDGSLCIKDDQALESIPALYASFGDLIDTATIRNPTLEDVFLMATGKQARTLSETTHRSPHSA